MTRATQVLGGLLGLGAVAAVLTVFLEDSLVRSWAEHNPSVSPTLESGGLDAVKDSSVQIPAFDETISGDDPDEGALSGLPRSADQHDSRVSQGGVHLRRGAARNEKRSGHSSS